MFEPVNALETLMQSAASNPAKIPDFYRALLDSELYILTPETELEPGRRRSLKLHEKISVATVEFKGKTWHPAFTAPERVSAYLKEPETCLEAKARDLFALLPPGSNFWLNPQSECQKPLPGDEISLLLSGKIFAMDFRGSARPRRVNRSTHFPTTACRAELSAQLRSHRRRGATPRGGGSYPDLRHVHHTVLEPLRVAHSAAPAIGAGPWRR